MDLRELGWGGGGVDSPCSGARRVACSDERGDERPGSGARELVNAQFLIIITTTISVTFFPCVG
jgi:hypothetical protein